MVGIVILWHLMQDDPRIPRGALGCLGGGVQGRACRCQELLPCPLGRSWPHAKPGRPYLPLPNPKSSCPGHSLASSPCPRLLVVASLHPMETASSGSGSPGQGENTAPSCSHKPSGGPCCLTQLGFWNPRSFSLFDTCCQKN